MPRFLPMWSAVSARYWLRLALALVLVTSSWAAAADDGPVDGREVTSEYQLKAALLYKLTRFIQWPKSEAGRQRFNMCVLGDNVFGDALEPLRERQVGKREITVNYYDQSDEISAHCDLLFIEKSKRPYLQTILGKFNQPGILTISDIADFAGQGGIIELILIDNKIAFRINLQRSKTAELSMAAPLISIRRLRILTEILFLTALITGASLDDGS